jgi:ArsR family transcriptional regulator
MYNKKMRHQTKTLANLFRTLGQPARLRIILAIGEGEACVCHLEALLGYRQAYISQHLMELRKVGILDARRDGRFIFYRLRDTTILGVIREAGTFIGLSDAEIDALIQQKGPSQCCCPKCIAETSTTVTTEIQITERLS